MTSQKPKIKTRAQLLQQVADLEAQLNCAYGSAMSTIDKTGNKHMMASGVLVRLCAIGGREIVTPFMVTDGLSDETIAALKADIRRSYNLSHSLNNSRVNKP